MSLENVERILKDVARSANTKVIADELSNAVDTAIAKSTLKPDVAKIPNLSFLSSTAPTTRTDLPGTQATVTDNPVAITSIDANIFSKDLVTKVEAAGDDLKAITGSSKLSANGELTLAFTSPLPQALAETLKDVTTANTSQIKGILSTVSNASADILDDIVSETFGQAVSSLSKLKNTVNLIETANLRQINNIKKTGFEGIIDNVIEQGLGVLNSSIISAAVKNGIKIEVPDNVSKQIAALIDQGKIKQAAILLSSFSDKSLSELEGTLSNISVRPSDNLTPANVNQVEIDIEDVIDIKQRTNQWKEDLTNPANYFNIIGNTAREILPLTKELSNLTRDVSEVIIYSLPASQEITAVNLHNKYVEQYGYGINPHFYITKAGIAYRGRPLEVDVQKIGALGELLKDHSKHSICIGINCKDGMSPSQSNSLYFIIKAILFAMPGILIYDLNDLGSQDTNVTDIHAWLRSKFPGWEQLTEEEYDPKKKDSLTKQSLVNLINTKVE